MSKGLRTAEVAADGVVAADGRFLPWALLVAGPLDGQTRRLVFRAPDGRLVDLEAPADLRVPDLAPPPPSTSDLLPRVVLGAAAAGGVGAAVAASAAEVFLDALPVDLRSFVVRRGAEAAAASALIVGSIAGEAIRRVLLRRARPLRTAEAVARRMEVATVPLEVRHRIRSVEIAWRCRAGSWERWTSDGEGAWVTRSTPAEARAGLARLLAAGAAPEPRRIG